MKTTYFEMLFFWFFGELETCEDIRNLDLLVYTFETNYRFIEEGNQPILLIQGYRRLTYPWHERDQTELLFKTGMI